MGHTNIKKGEVGNEKTNFEVLCIWSSLLYGSKTWTLIKDTIDRLEVFEMWTLRRMLKISWKNEISNERVLLMAKTKREIIVLIANQIPLQKLGSLIGTQLVVSNIRLFSRVHSPGARCEESVLNEIVTKSSI